MQRNNPVDFRIPEILSAVLLMRQGTVSHARASPEALDPNHWHCPCRVERTENRTGVPRKDLHEVRGSRMPSCSGRLELWGERARADKRATLRLACKHDEIEGVQHTVNRATTSKAIPRWGRDGKAHALVAFGGG
jgi:hypothetical protein